MKSLTRKFALIIFITLVARGLTFTQESDEQIKIKSIVNLYEKALNNNCVEGILQLFTEEGVLILQGAPTIIGVNAVQEFYTSLFRSLDFDLKFNIDEVVQMSHDWAFVRTTTTGTVHVLSSNSSNPGNGHEIFILNRQSDGAWKIARYAGSSSK